MAKKGAGNIHLTDGETRENCLLRAGALDPNQRVEFR
jgi:hypothetical protein